MKTIDCLTVKYHDRIVGKLSLTPDDKFCAFEYDSSLDRLSLVGSGGMGALTYHPETIIQHGTAINDLDLLQQKALEVLKERQDSDAGLLLYNSGNSGGARPKAVFHDEEGHWLVKFRHTYDPKDIGQQEYHYHETARKCGICVPDFKLINGQWRTCHIC